MHPHINQQNEDKKNINRRLYSGTGTGPVPYTLALRLHNNALSHRKHPCTCTCTRFGFLAATRWRVMLRLHATRKLFQFWRCHRDIVQCGAGHDMTANSLGRWSLSSSSSSRRAVVDGASFTEAFDFCGHQRRKPVVGLMVIVKISLETFLVVVS